MEAILFSLILLWQWAAKAARGSISSANNWAWALGLTVVLAVTKWIWTKKMNLDLGINPDLESGITDLAAAWLIIFIGKFLRAPFQHVKALQDENKKLQDTIKNLTASLPSIPVSILFDPYNMLNARYGDNDGMGNIMTHFYIGIRNDSASEYLCDIRVKLEESLYIVNYTSSKKSEYDLIGPEYEPPAPIYRLAPRATEYVKILSCFHPLADDLAWGANLGGFEYPKTLTFSVEAKSKASKVISFFYDPRKKDCLLMSGGSG